MHSPPWYYKEDTIPTPLGPIMDTSDGATRGFILYKHEPVG